MVSSWLCSAMQFGMKEWGGYSVRNFIYLFHLAIFYFASGYLYKEKYASDFKTFILKRIKSLYIPYVVYGCAFLFLHNIFCSIGLYSPNTVYASGELGQHLFSLIKFNYFEALSGVFWFFKSLFVVSVGFEIGIYSIHKFKYGKRLELAYMGILSVVGIVACYYTFPCNKTLGNLALLPVLYVGYYVSRNSFRLLSLAVRYRYLAALVSLAILLWNSNYEVSINAQNIGSNPIVFYVCAFSGIYLMLYVVDYTPKSLRLFVDYIGRNTSSVFIWHFLCFRLASWLIIESNGLDIKNLMCHPIVPNHNVLWIMIYFITGVGGSLLVGYVIQFIKTKLRQI